MGLVWNDVPSWTWPTLPQVYGSALAWQVQVDGPGHSLSAPWNFSSFIPSAVLINLGTNDSGAVVGGVANFTGLTAAFTSATTSAGAGVSALDLTTASGAQAALATVDAAISTVNSTRAALGAYQARFSSVVASLATTGENLTASRSRVHDADFAAETANLSRAQILQQAGTAMVAQANQLPQGVLALLR